MLPKHVHREEETGAGRKQVNYSYSVFCLDSLTLKPPCGQFARHRNKKLTQIHPGGTHPESLLLRNQRERGLYRRYTKIYFY